MDYKSKIKEMIWSFSRLSTFNKCKYAFYLNYLQEDNKEYLPEGNYYAEVGSFMHNILEKIFKGELQIKDAANYFIDNYDSNVFYSVRESIMDKTYDKCLSYLADTDFDWINQYEILGVEKEIKFKIEDKKFIGYIDLLLRDKSDGRIVVMDHKSDEYPFNKNGSIKAKCKELFEDHKRQMYLYSCAINDEYHEYPKELRWNHFKDEGKVSLVVFDKKDYDKSIEWALNTIRAIETETDYISDLDPQGSDFFFCNNICGFRNSCEYNI